MRGAKIKRISKSNQQSKCKYFHDAKIWVRANSNSPLMMIAQFLILPPLLLENIMNKQKVANHIAAPHAFRFHQQAVEPFEGSMLPAERGTFESTGEEVEHSADSTAVAVYIELIPMGVGPFFLFRGSHTHPKQVWFCLVDSVDDGLVILVREDRS